MVSFILWPTQTLETVYGIGDCPIPNPSYTQWMIDYDWLT